MVDYDIRVKTQQELGVLASTQNPTRQYPRHYEFQKWWKN